MSGIIISKSACHHPRSDLNFFRYCCTDILPQDLPEGRNSAEQRGERGSGMGVGMGGGQRVGALDPLTRKSFIHFVATAGDGFVPPTAGKAAAEVAAPFATTTPSAKVAACSGDQEGEEVLACSPVCRAVATDASSDAAKSSSGSPPFGMKLTKENMPTYIHRSPGLAARWITREPKLSRNQRKLVLVCFGALWASL